MNDNLFGPLLYFQTHLSQSFIILTFTLCIRTTLTLCFKFLVVRCGLSNIYIYCFVIYDFDWIFHRHLNECNFVYTLCKRHVEVNFDRWYLKISQSTRTCFRIGNLAFPLNQIQYSQGYLRDGFLVWKHKIHTPNNSRKQSNISQIIWIHTPI